MFFGLSSASILLLCHLSDTFDTGHNLIVFAVKIHGVAALLSFFNIIRAASVYNERKTYTLLFVMVGYPCIHFTILCRTLALSVIVSFLNVGWTIVLFIGYTRRERKLAEKENYFVHFFIYP